MRRIAIQSLVHDRGKLVAALTGVAFAAALVLIQTGLYEGFRYNASIPIFFISVLTCLRPITWPSRLSMSRSIRLPAKGYSRCSSSIRRISARSDGEVGAGV